MARKKTWGLPFPNTLQEAIQFFADEDNALAYVVERRWQDGVSCPTCGSKAVLFLKNQRRWKCGNDHPRRQFSAKVGTIMEDSPLKLGTWVAAMWMIANCKNGISSYEIHRALGITQKSAWFVLHRVRLAMQDGAGGGTIEGEIECDESYIGGKARFMHKHRKERKIKGRGTDGKAVVMGLLSRHSSKGHSTVIARVIKTPTRETLQGAIREHVAPGSEIHTDEHAGYAGLEEYTHRVINHAEHYVAGSVTTNRIENFWSLLKRGIRGTYVSVEPFHLFRYVDEQAFRFNTRKDEEGDHGRFMTLLGYIAGKRLTYKQLIGEAPATT